MKTIKSASIALFVALLLNGCAASYHRINPQTLNYGGHDIQQGVSISYKHRVMEEKGNKKYAKKEEKSGVRILAVKLTNDSNQALNVSRDLLFYAGNNQVSLMEPTEIFNEIKQQSGWYYAYLALSFMNLYVTTDKGSNTYPVGVIVGPGLTVGNVLTSNKANKNLKNELFEYDIVYRDIQKGETVYGLIGIRSSGYGPLTVKVKAN